MRGLGAQDLVVLALKSHQIAPVVEDIRSLFGPETIVLTTQNGIPWWYFQKLDGPYANRVVKTVDPNGVLSARIDPDRVIGCIAYPAATITEPGDQSNLWGDSHAVEAEGSGSIHTRGRACSIRKTV